jgi:hypothetical protein
MMLLIMLIRRRGEQQEGANEGVDHRRKGFCYIDS